MFTRLTISTDTTPLLELSATAAHAGEKFAALLPRAISTRKPELHKIIAVYPRERTADDHVRWKSNRQRRAFYATNGFGRGIPTFRTGALGELFDVTVSGDGRAGSIFIENSASYARYVIGDDQQPFHDDLGWLLVGERGANVAPVLIDIASDVWAVATDVGESS